MTAPPLIRNAFFWLRDLLRTRIRVPHRFANDHDGRATDARHLDICHQLLQRRDD